jgi:hypothetical protein
MWHEIGGHDGIKAILDVANRTDVYCLPLQLTLGPNLRCHAGGEVERWTPLERSPGAMSMPASIALYIADKKAKNDPQMVVAILDIFSNSVAAHTLS